MSTLKKILFISATVILFSACNSSTDETKDIDSAASHDMHKMPMASSGYADSVNNGLITQDTMKSSPERTAMASVGKTHLHITYHAPGVKGRIIWGGLVPYNAVWVTGAHTATSIQINNAIEINDKKIEAGTYAVFTIPGEKEWTFILNKNYQQHLADDYKETEDVLRMAVKPIENKMIQRLTYTIKNTSENSGSISMEWEKIKIEVPFKVL
ncbi:DUF2911 domain-containing protein [Limnovirga soli]|nr:DUF2911 domain-containing protein [Limnovirga soli]